MSLGISVAINMTKFYLLGQPLLHFDGGPAVGNGIWDGLLGILQVCSLELHSWPALCEENFYCDDRLSFREHP